MRVFYLWLFQSKFESQYRSGSTILYGTKLIVALATTRRAAGRKARCNPLGVFWHILFNTDSDWAFWFVLPKASWGKTSVSTCCREQNWTLRSNGPEGVRRMDAPNNPLGGPGTKDTKFTYLRITKPNRNRLGFLILPAPTDWRKTLQVRLHLREKRGQERKKKRGQSNCITNKPQDTDFLKRSKSGSLFYNVNLNWCGLRPILNPQPRYPFELLHIVSNQD